MMRRDSFDSDRGKWAAYAPLGKNNFLIVHYCNLAFCQELFAYLLYNAIVLCKGDY